MLNGFNSWTETAISSACETTCATIREMRKRNISIIGSPWAEGLKKRNGWWERQTYSSHSRFSIRTRLFAARHVLRMGREVKKNERKRTRRRKESPWRHRPETERFQMRRKREDRKHERGITGERTPTMPARTTDMLLHKAANPLFRNLSTGIDARRRAIWYDTGRGRNSAASKRHANRRWLRYPKFENMRATFLNCFDKSYTGIFLVRLI